MTVLALWRQGGSVSGSFRKSNEICMVFLNTKELACRMQYQTRPPRRPSFMRRLTARPDKGCDWSIPPAPTTQAQKTAAGAVFYFWLGNPYADSTDTKPVTYSVTTFITIYLFKTFLLSYSSLSGKRQSRNVPFSLPHVHTIQDPILINAIVIFYPIWGLLNLSRNNCNTVLACFWTWRGIIL